MKKLIMTMAILMLMLTFASCGGGQTTSDAEVETETEQSTGLFGSKSIQGEWIANADDEDYKEVLTIDGDSVLFESWTGYNFKGKVNKRDSTIIFEDDDGEEPRTCSYEIIGRKLVLTSEDFGTRTFEKASVEE